MNRATVVFKRKLARCTCAYEFAGEISECVQATKALKQENDTTIACVAHAQLGKIGKSIANNFKFSI